MIGNYVKLFDDKSSSNKPTSFSKLYSLKLFSTVFYTGKLSIWFLDKSRKRKHGKYSTAEKGNLVSLFRLKFNS